MVGLGQVYNAVFFISLGGFLFGYIIGVHRSVVASGQLKCPKNWEDDIGTWTSVGYGQCYDLDKFDIHMLNSLHIVGAILSSLVCFNLADKIGRKREAQLGAALYFVGSALTASAPVLWAIYFGLLVYGFGIGFSMHAAPLYIAEISPARDRGALVSLKEAMIVAGIFLGYLFGAVCEPHVFVGWRFMMVVPAVLATFMEVGICVLHRSPRWLMLQAVRNGGLLGPESSYLTEAKAALQFFREGASPDEVEIEVLSIMDGAQEIVCTNQTRWVDAFRCARPIVIGCGLVSLQQITGQPFVLHYAAEILRGAGLKSYSALLTVGVGLVKLPATMITVWRVDRYGRRQFLLLGITLMIIALAILAASFRSGYCDIQGVETPDCPIDQIRLPYWWSIATVVAVALFVSGYQLGFGPISWLMISEVYPLRIRGSAVSVAAVVNFSSHLAMVSCMSDIMDLLTPSGLFVSFLALSMSSFIFVMWLVPETRGRTLEQIEKDLAPVKRAVGSSITTPSTSTGDLTASFRS